MNENQLSTKLNKVDTSIAQIRTNLKLNTDENIENMVDIIGDGKYAPRFITFENYKGTELDYEISHLNIKNLTSLSSMFSYVNVQELDLSDWNVENITSFASMFSNSKLQKINMEGWNTKNGQSFAYMFNNCSSLINIDVAHFDMSNATQIQGMFSGSGHTGELIFPENADVSKCTDFTNLFQGCQKITKIKNISSWNTENLTNCMQFFHDCRQLKELDISEWNVSKVTSLSQAFNGCNALETLDLSKWKTGVLTSFGYCFMNMNKIKKLELTGFNTSSLSSLSSIFSSDTNLEYLNLNGWNTEKVTNMSSLFAGCTSLKYLDLRTFDFTKVTNYSSMFGYGTTSYVPSDCEIIVKDEAAKTWITSKFSFLTNIKTVAEYETV